MVHWTCWRPPNVEQAAIVIFLLQVLGNGKGVIAVVVSILVFQNPWTLQSMGGYCLATGGVAWYMHETRIAKAAQAAPAVQTQKQLF